MSTSLRERVALRALARQKEVMSLKGLSRYAHHCGIEFVNIAPMGAYPNSSHPRKFMCCLPRGEPFTYSVGAGIIVGNDWRPRAVADHDRVMAEIDTWKAHPMEVLGAVCSDIVSIEGHDNWVEWCDDYSLIGSSMEAETQRRAFYTIQQRRAEIRALCGRNTDRLINAMNEFACEGTTDGIKIPEVI